MTMIVICFDISDDKRLRRIARLLEDVGQRVQRSVFECYLDADELAQLQHKIAAILDEEQDHVRYYPLCGKDLDGIKIDGAGDVSSNPDYHLL